MNRPDWGKTHDELRYLRDTIFLIIDLYRGHGVAEDHPIMVRMKEVIMLPTKYKMIAAWEEMVVDLEKNKESLKVEDLA